MKSISIQRRTVFYLGFLTMILFLAGCDGESPSGGGGGGGCTVANCFGGGRTGGGSQNSNLSISAVPGDGQNILVFALSSGNATSFNIYWSISPDTTTPTWNKIEGATSPFVHANLSNGVPRFYGVTAVSGGNESDPSGVVGAMPGKWTQLNTLIDPPARDGHTAVYNPTTDRMILFGGKNQSAIFQDLWILSDASGAIGNTEWTPLSPSVPPDRRVSHTAVYDKQSNKMIVFAGSLDPGGIQLTNDLWSLSNADNSGVAPTWQLLSPSGQLPSNRWGHAAVYDEQADIMIVFGGAETGAAIFKDVWVLEGATAQFTSTWRQIPMPTTGGPSARCCMAVGYDSTNNRMIIFGGFGGFGQGGATLFGDLWTLTFNETFTAATWKELTPSGGTAPSARCCTASFWDGSKFLLFGGGSFNNPSDDKIHALVLHDTTPTFGSAVGPGGGPVARNFPTGVPAGLFLLFGGETTSDSLNDLWRLE